MTHSAPIPSKQHLAALTAASVANAQAYLREAVLLLDNGAWPRAHSIATLAFEEIGKAHLCMTLIGIPEQYRSEFPFWQSFRDHRAKLTFAYLLLAILGDEEPPKSMAGVFQAVTSAANTDNATKFRGLYVDYEDGLLRLPTDVDESTARAMVSRVTQVLDTIGSAYSLENLLSFISAEGTDREVIEHMTARWVAAGTSDEDELIATLRGDLNAMRQGTFEFLPKKEIGPAGL